MKTRTLKTAGAMAIFVVVMTAQSVSAYYNPSTGRWLSRDPIGERGGLNPYGLLKNDPLDRIDRLGLYDAYYAGFHRARFSQHGSYMNFIGRCPICEEIDPDSVKINFADIAQAIIAELQTHIASDNAALAAYDGPPNSLTDAYQLQIGEYKKAISDLQTNPTHASGLKGVENQNIHGDPITMEIFMNSRYSLGFPGTLDGRYVRDEVDIYTAVTKVTYECVLVCTLHPLPPSQGPGY